MSAGFLSGWILKPSQNEIVVGQVEVIDRPVKVIETKYILPPLNCEKTDIDPNVGGMMMDEYIIWGQQAWNWISDCSDSIIDWQDEIDQKML